jgi:GT2 family glycosyltransferase
MAPILQGDAATYRPARLAHARAVGVRHAATDLVAFLDDDNEFEPDHIGSLVEAITEDPSLMAVHSWRMILEADGSPYLRPESPWEGDPELARRDYQEFVDTGVWVPGTNLMRDRVDRNTVDFSCWVLRRELLDLVPFRLAYSPQERAHRLGEDVAFCFDLSHHRIPVGCVQRHSVRYYLGGFTTSGRREYAFPA